MQKKRWIAKFVMCSILSIGSPAWSQILIGSVKVKNELEIKRARYNEYRGIVATLPPNLPKVYGIEKRNIRILFISPDTETNRREFVFVQGLIKPSKENQDLIAIDNKIVHEFPWIALEITGFVSQVDAVEAEFFDKSIEKNYDYIVNVSTNFNGKRDPKSTMERVISYNLKKVSDQRTELISQTTRFYTSPAAIAAALFKAVDQLEQRK